MVERRQQGVNSLRPQKEARNQKKTNWPVTYKWIAMGTLVAYTAIGSLKITLAQSREDAADQNHSQTQTTLPSTKFEIASGVLGDALDTFHSLTGLQITVTNDGIRNRTSKPCRECWREPE